MGKFEATTGPDCMKTVKVVTQLRIKIQFKNLYLRTQIEIFFIQISVKNKGRERKKISLHPIFRRALRVSMYIQLSSRR